MPHTNRTVRTHTLATLSAAALLALSVGLPAAIGDDDLLRGPSVRQTAPPGGPSFAEERDPFMRAAAGRPLPYRMFLMAVRTLAPGRAQADLALSEEQVEAIRTFQSEHNQAILEYVQLHRAELEALIAAADLPTPRAMNGDAGQGRPNARPGNQRDTDNANPRQRRQGAPADRRAQMQDSPEAKARQEAMRLFAQMNSNALPDSRDPAVNAARARLAKLREGAPSHDEVRAKIWATLDEPQQQHVLAVIEKVYREQAERRAAQGMTDNKQQPGGPNAPEARPRDRREGAPRRGPRPGTDNRRQPRPDA